MFLLYFIHPLVKNCQKNKEKIVQWGAQQLNPIEKLTLIKSRPFLSFTFQPFQHHTHQNDVSLVYKKVPLERRKKKKYQKVSSCIMVYYLSPKISWRAWGERSCSNEHIYGVNYVLETSQQEKHLVEESDLQKNTFKGTGYAIQNGGGRSWRLSYSSIFASEMNSFMLIL